MNEKQAAALCAGCAGRIAEAYVLTPQKETATCSFCGAWGNIWFLEPKHRERPRYDRLRERQKRARRKADV